MTAHQWTLARFRTLGIVFTVGQCRTTIAFFATLVRARQLATTTLPTHDRTVGFSRARHLKLVATLLSDVLDAHVAFGPEFRIGAGLGGERTRHLTLVTARQLHAHAQFAVRTSLRTKVGALVTARQHFGARLSALLNAMLLVVWMTVARARVSTIEAHATRFVAAAVLIDVVWLAHFDQRVVSRTTQPQTLTQCIVVFQMIDDEIG
mmetsp:Transcript_16455/g.28250  ORF Transcript_16455/g.28250 Transcript_16455/m.28250 type:complete len:207 (+) Transcript_16455:3-623(+)